MFGSGLQFLFCRFLAHFEVDKDMEVSELRAAINELTARIAQIRDWL